MSLADAALYYGKEKHRNCWVIVNNERINALEHIDEVLSKPLSESIQEQRVSGDNFV